MEPLIVLMIGVACLHGREYVRAKHVHLGLVVAEAGDEQLGQLVLLLLQLNEYRRLGALLQFLDFLDRSLYLLHLESLMR